MPQSNFQYAHHTDTSNEMVQTRKRLIKEIACLERQLSRLQQLNQNSMSSTCKTYEEMISSRYEILDTFGLQ